MIRNIFFDFDGVLAESVNIKTEAFIQMYLPYGKDSACKILRHHLENGGMSRFEKFKIYQDWLGLESGSLKINELSSMFSGLVMKGVIDASEVKGTSTFLKKYFYLYQRWIISGTPTEEIKEIVSERKMKKYFTGIYGSPEKKHELTEQVINKWNLSRNETVFVGDATTDHEAAMKSGINFILRETPENSALFNHFNGPRIINMSQLNNVLITL